jgi:lysophospholipase L1-like esterase
LTQWDLSRYHRLVTKYTPLLLGFLLCLHNLTSAGSTNVAAKLSNAQQQTPGAVKNIFYLGDSYLDDGNYQALTGFPLEYASNEPPWGTDVNLALGFKAVGRWTAAGSPPNSLGNNYAVSGASIAEGLAPVDTSFRAQVNLMLSDYPDGLPTDTLVVVAIGTNDIIGALEAGGIWSPNLSGWQLNRSGFTVPAVGSTVTVQVADNTGLVAGPNNRVVFPNSPYLTMFSVTAVDVQTSTVTLTNVSATPGTLVPRHAAFQMAASYFLDLSVPIFARGIKALLADHANLVLTLPWRTDLLPLYDQKANQTLAYSTWLYLYTNMETAIAKETPQALYFDLSDYFAAVYFNYSQYGFLYNYPGWDDNPNLNANSYMFWDSLHPSGKMHQLIADDFIQFLNQFGLVTEH